jgi:hypothetical protein
METFWTIVALAFALGVFAPLVVGAIALPLVVVAMLWRIVHP